MSGQSIRETTLSTLDDVLLWPPGTAAAYAYGYEPPSPGLVDEPTNETNLKFAVMIGGQIITELAEISDPRKRAEVTALLELALIRAQEAAAKSS